jgi:hypothetical protein
LIEAFNTAKGLVDTSEEDRESKTDAMELSLAAEWASIEPDLNLQDTDFISKVSDGGPDPEERKQTLTFPSGCENPDNDWVYNTIKNPVFEYNETRLNW